MWWIKLLHVIGLMHQTPFRRPPSSYETALRSRRYITVCAAVSRRRTASALRREAPHYAGFEPAVGSGTGFGGRPKVNKQETQLFRRPPQRDLKFSLSSLCHNLKLIQSERRRHAFSGCAAGPPRRNTPDLCRSNRHSSEQRCGVT